MMWNNRGNILPDNSISESAYMYNWFDVLFWLVWICAFASVALNKTSLLPLAMGITVIVATYRLGNVLSWTTLNFERILNQSNSFAYLRVQVAGGILAFFGILLALFAAAMPVSFKPTEKSPMMTHMICMLALVFTLIGTIVLWNTVGASSSSFPVYNQTIDSTVMIWLSQIFVFIGIVCTKGDVQILQGAAGFFAAYTFAALLGDMFSVHFQSGDGNNTYAGYFFCWLASIFHMIAAYTQSTSDGVTV